MWAKIITNYFSLCALNLFNTQVSQFELNYWSKWTFPRHSNLLRCTCILMIFQQHSPANSSTPMTSALGPNIRHLTRWRTYWISNMVLKVDFLSKWRLQPSATKTVSSSHRSVLLASTFLDDTGQCWTDSGRDKVDVLSTLSGGAKPPIRPAAVGNQKSCSTLSTSVRWLSSMADSRLYTWLNKILFCDWACNGNAKKKKKTVTSTPSKLQPKMLFRFEKLKN